MIYINVLKKAESIIKNAVVVTCIYLQNLGFAWISPEVKKGQNNLKLVVDRRR